MVQIGMKQLFSRGKPRKRLEATKLSRPPAIALRKRVGKHASWSSGRANGLQTRWRLRWDWVAYVCGCQANLWDQGFGRSVQVGCQSWLHEQTTGIGLDEALGQGAVVGSVLKVSQIYNKSITNRKRSLLFEQHSFGRINLHKVERNLTTKAFQTELTSGKLRFGWKVADKRFKGSWEDCFYLLPKYNIIRVTNCCNQIILFTLLP